MNIVIKLPNDLRERILSFPLLHALESRFKEKLKKDEVLKIHLISLEKDIDVLYLLPFQAFYHELEDADIKSVFSIHRACANFKINQPDYFISTTDSFVDASIGKNLGALTKIGFSTGRNSWVLNKKIPKTTNGHKSERMFSLLSGVFKEAPVIAISSSRSLPPLYSDWESHPYTVLNLDIIDGKINPEWKDFIDLFINKKFIFMCSDLPAFEQKNTLVDFIKECSDKNIYNYFEYGSNIEFGKLISYSLTFVTKDSVLVNIAAYCGTCVFLVNAREDLNLSGAKYFQGEVFDSPLSSEQQSAEGSAYTKSFDEIYKYIEDKTRGKDND